MRFLMRTFFAKFGLQETISTSILMKHLLNATLIHRSITLRTITSQNFKREPLYIAIYRAWYSITWLNKVLVNNFKEPVAGSEKLCKENLLRKKGSWINFKDYIINNDNILTTGFINKWCNINFLGFKTIIFGHVRVFEENTEGI